MKEMLNENYFQSRKHKSQKNNLSRPIQDELGNFVSEVIVRHTSRGQRSVDDSKRRAPCEPAMNTDSSCSTNDALARPGHDCTVRTLQPIIFNSDPLGMYAGLSAPCM
jgi:hypothetical protein